MGVFAGWRSWGGLFLLVCLVVSCSWDTSLKKRDVIPDAPPENVRAEEPAPVPAEPAAAKAHLALARSHLNYRNPKSNYPGAYQEIKTYLSLAPEAATEDLRNWLAALAEMDRLRKRGEELGKKGEELSKRNQSLQGQVDKLQAGLERSLEANKTLRDEIAGLKETNAKLKETLEQLKNLDLQMEEKRRIFR